MEFLLKNDYSTRQATPPPADAGASTKLPILIIGRHSISHSTEAGPSSEPRTESQKRHSSAETSLKQSKRPSLSAKSLTKKIKSQTSVTPETAQANASVSPQMSAGRELTLPETSGVSSTTYSYQGVIDEDEAFFISMRPHMKKFSHYQKLEFRKRAYMLLQEITELGQGATSASISQNNGRTDGCFYEVKEEYTVSDSE